MFLRKSPKSMGFSWKLSNCPRPSAVLSCCPGDGWSNARLLGPHVFDGWCVITSDFLPLLLAFIRSFSPRSCLINGLPSRVPHRLSFGKDATEGESYVFFHVIDSKPRARERAVYL